MGNEYLFTDAPRLQLPARNQIVKGPDRDGELSCGLFPVIQEPGFRHRVDLYVCTYAGHSFDYT